MSIQWAAGGDDLYTIALVDPDGPSRANPIRGECLHWLVVNVRGTEPSTGETLVEYIGSGPPEGTGLHRYILLIYRQPGKLDMSEFKKVPKNELPGRIHVRLC